MKQLQIRLMGWVITPSLIGVIAIAVCIPLFIKLGLWQYHKAQQQLLVQAAYQQSVTNLAIDLPLNLASYNDLKYKKVKVSGHYETKFQILLDNQVENDRAGFHVVTPFKIANTSQYVLVDRGWILGKDTHTELPAFDTPSNNLEVVGQVWLPSVKIFSLEKKIAKSNLNNKADAIATTWQLLWQYMDMAKYKASAPITVLPVVIRLDAQSHAGGFVRNWQIPADRIATNLGYAYQWFGFAVAALSIFLVMSIKRQS